MFKSSVTLTGRLIIKKFNEKNELVYSTEIPNLVVTTGKEFIASRIVGTSYDAMDYMSIGDDASIAALSQTTLINELTRVGITSTELIGSNVTFNALFPAGSGTGSIVEAGIFNKDETSVLTFDGAIDVASNTITYVNHGLTTGAKVTYTNGGGTSIGGLTTGSTYYIVKITNDTFKLALTYANATALTPIVITLTDGIGSNHKVTYGTMLCRTTFPVIVKTSTDSIAISWVVSVG